MEKYYVISKIGNSVEQSVEVFDNLNDAQFYIYNRILSISTRRFFILRAIDELFVGRPPIFSNKTGTPQPIDPSALGSGSVPQP